MEDRPDLDYSLPRYSIKYLDPELGWQISQWKMTIPYAVKQYDGLEWDHLPETEEFYDAAAMPVFHANSASKFQRGG